jgi:hypothetical protein
MKIRCPDKISGFTFIAYLPPEYDDDTRLHIWTDDTILVVHPNQPPRYIDRETGELKDFDWSNPFFTAYAADIKEYGLCY